MPDQDTPARFMGHLTRRAAIVAAAAGTTGLVTRGVEAQTATPVPEATPNANEAPSLLFIQHAGQTILSPGIGDIHTLTMTGVTAQSLYFSDRPDRITGAVPTAMFAEHFGEAFSDNPPNACLVGHLESGAVEEEAVVLTLLSAAYEASARTLTYEVTLLDVERITDRMFEREPLTVLDATRDYVEASLFIDDVTLDSQHTDDPDGGQISRPVVMVFELQKLLFVPEVEP